MEENKNIPKIKKNIIYTNIFEDYYKKLTSDIKTEEKLFINDNMIPFLVPGYISNNVKSITIRCQKKCQIDISVLPETLEILTISSDIVPDFLPESLPKNLKLIYFNYCKIDCILDNFLPENLEYLFIEAHILTDNFLNKLPSNLKYFFTTFRPKFEILPETLEYLSIATFCDVLFYFVEQNKINMRKMDSTIVGFFKQSLKKPDNVEHKMLFLQKIYQKI